jgi:mannosyltransferase
MLCQAPTNPPFSYFYKHKLLQKYEWYWRLEPEIKYFCDIT